MLQASPDFKGIKTARRIESARRWRFKPALISKGLRRTAPSAQRRPAIGFKPALISKGLRPDYCANVTDGTVLQASPDFKGIKTPRGT